MTSLVWNGAPPEAKSELKEILRQKDLWLGLFVFHPRLGDATERKLKDALFSFKDIPQGKIYFEKKQAN